MLNMDYWKIIELGIYFLAILNPVSKVMFLTTYEPSLTREQTTELAWKSSLAALLMLEAFAITGNFILNEIFRIQMYSFQITGGLVVFVVGWTAIREGRFFQKKENELRQTFNEISIVPLAAPLIAGPGTISIAIAFSAQYGNLTCFLIMLFAVSINLVLMIFSLQLNHILQRLHLTGPLIRITGLIVASVAVQMILSGMSAWIISIYETFKL